MFCVFNAIENGFVKCELCGRIMSAEFNDGTHVCPVWEREQPEPEPTRYKLVSGNMHGIGDLMLLLWLAEGVKNAPVKLLIYATGQRRILCEMFGHNVLANRITTDSLPDYDYELAHPEIPRIVARAKGLEITETPIRPVATIADFYHDWAQKQCSQGKRLVLLFPTSAHR